MTEVRTLSGPGQKPASGGEPKQLVVLLHGVGADGDDLIGLAPHWARLLPDAEFLSPHAPYPCDMAPFGYQWFSLLDRSPSKLLAGIRQTAPILDAFLTDAMVSRGLAPWQTALVGFSQGTMMALHVAPRRAQALAAVLGYSGALVGDELLRQQILSKPPVQLIHGQADEVVPFQAMAAAAETLSAAGVRVGTAARPGMGHGIDPDGLMLGGRFLVERFAEAEKAAKADMAGTGGDEKT
ncbi:MAG: phospholipase [Alphaproteobacteria bacterium]|nr:phospholipase [Alphaproteobacteria bacterium]